jgi:hypothetical protein
MHQCKENSSYSTITRILVHLLPLQLIIVLSIFMFALWQKVRFNVAMTSFTKEHSMVDAS